MHTIRLHDTALDLATDLVATVRPEDRTRASPCADWDLAALLAHMTGQNHGFADALRGGTDPAAYTPVAGDGWPASVADLRDAIAQPGTETVLLAEISTQHRLDVDTVLRMHLLDTVVHAWDVATALGTVWRPPAELADAVGEIAPMVPTDAQTRTRPGASFGPVRDTPGDDPWIATLARLGRAA